MHAMCFGRTRIFVKKRSTKLVATNKTSLGRSYHTLRHRNTCAAPSRAPTVTSPSYNTRREKRRKIGKLATNQHYSCVKIRKPPIKIAIHLPVNLPEDTVMADISLLMQVIHEVYQIVVQSISFVIVSIHRYYQVLLQQHPASQAGPYLSCAVFASLICLQYYRCLISHCPGLCCTQSCQQGQT